MASTFEFVVDRSIHGRIYPAMAQHQAEPYTMGWREFDQHWPYTVPLRLQEYCDSHDASIALYHSEQSAAAGWYPIALGWFDFDIDYFALLPSAILNSVQQGSIKLLFYYHEGDNPARIRQRLDSLCELHSCDPNCYLFVINNSAAEKIQNFIFFPDSELWFWQRNRRVPALPFNRNSRSRKFTALVRTHKDYRMAVMADLWRLGILDQSYWSYCEPGNIAVDQCPVAIDEISDLWSTIEQFQKQVPQLADDLTQPQRNDHGHIVESYFNDSYFHIVLETHFDADQSGGTLLSEKTFKPIKHAQPFFVVGPAGSLQCLRDLGYRTFDHVIDNSYDSVENNTQRWLALRESIVQTAKQDTWALALACQADCIHNQTLFCASKHARLSKLAQQIYEHC
jgi:hypothetical protein